MSEYSGHDKKGRSVGIVRRECFSFAEPPEEMILESGAKLGPIMLAYETYGRLNEDKSNAVMVLHALSGNSHAAGYYSEADSKPGWWDNMIGPGKGIDTDEYFVLCSNMIGSCYGSTGPSSPDPRTGKPYGLHFPLFTFADVVNAQKKLVDHLGIERLLCLVGGSIGGMQAIEWAVTFPEMVRSAIPIASTCKRSALSIGLSEAQRQAIMADPNWNGGDYYGGPRPDKGLALARIIGHITYLSEDSMQRKFGRRLQENAAFKFDFSPDFQVESYLHYQGKKFVERFDANSYLYITKAIDLFDVMRGKSLAEVFKGLSAKVLVIAFKSDWLYPPYQTQDIVRACKLANLDATYCEIESSYGHDAFLLETDEETYLIKHFLERVLNGHTSIEYGN